MPNLIAFDDARERLKTSRRILVIGCSGLGKSTLSQQLAAKLDLPYLSMDREVLWRPGWVLRDRPARREILGRLVRGERWIIDGNGSSSLDIRLPRAELVIWLDLPRRAALLGLAKRVARHYGTVRADMAPGCPEQLPDREFLAYIWHFNRDTAPRMAQAIDRHGPTVPVAMIQSRAQAKLLAGPG